MESVGAARRTEGGVLADLGLSSDPLELIAATEAGLPVSTFSALSRSLGVTEAELATVSRISQTTLSRRKRSGRLEREESDHVLRIASLLDVAARIFESVEDGANWLKEPNISLGGKPPLTFASTEVGAREVRDLLGRIEYGVYS